MLEALPTELQEKICNLLDGPSLLRACCVSVTWHRIISGLQVVWHQASLREGFGPNATDWKCHYLTCLRLLQHLKNGTAFQHKNFAPKSFHCSDVRDVAFWNGCILAGIHKLIRVWTIEDLKPTTAFEVPYEVFHLSVSQDGQVLGVGHYDGAITTWLLNEPDIRPNFLQQYYGHTDNVVCLSIAPQINLLCSGSRDRTIKLWCLGSGQLLETLPAYGWVAQVTLMPAGSHNSVYEHRNVLLAADQSNIHLYSWPVKHKSLYDDSSIIQATDFCIPVDNRVSMRKFLVQGRHIIYVQDGAIMMQDVLSSAQVKCFRIDCKDMVLLASGKRYMLVAMWESCLRNCKLAIVDSSDGQLVGTYPMPLEHVITGDTAWLDGVSRHKPCHLVAAGWMMGILHMNQLTDVLYLITWLPDEVSLHYGSDEAPDKLVRASGPE